MKKVKIKKYWKIYYVFNYPCVLTKQYIVIANSPQTAVKKFYKLNNKYCLKNGFIVEKVEPFEIEVVE